MGKCMAPCAFFRTMRHQLDVISTSVPFRALVGTMPAFDQRLSDSDLDDLVKYLHTLKNNVLMLLDGLLRYRHPDFTNEVLDDVERFLDGLNEHPFQIPEKLAAIRTSRLLQQSDKASQVNGGAGSETA